ncbi:hypothetical protein CKAH01_05571 [Colletotrichum kahawae]|uniref:Uncharacterized protein n=1 Tax=Colletotrichum kahawae TaxID=34407 RepID=A0AAD9YED6_COLKA|nr:hypothetical protein CKAH01_05571 [Colletotrichum kahawae]
MKLLRVPSTPVPAVLLQPNSAVPAKVARRIASNTELRKGSYASVPPSNPRRRGDVNRSRTSVMWEETDPVKPYRFRKISVV